MALGDDVPLTRQVSFEEWWHEIVFKDKSGNLLSRKELVLTAANQDGGGHVDPELDEVYDKLVRENTLGWLKSSGGKTEPIGDPTKASIRQIAHELIKLLKSRTVSNAPPKPD
jgi:hypothetical protein